MIFSELGDLEFPFATGLGVEFCVVLDGCPSQVTLDKS